MHSVKKQKMQNAQIAHMEARLGAIEKALGITPAPQGTEPYPEAVVNLKAPAKAEPPKPAPAPMANPPAGK